MSWSSESTVRAHAPTDGPDATVATLRLLHTPAAPPDQRELLVLMDGKEAGVGRTEDADLPLRDDQVSRAHLSVWREGDCVHIRDLESENGTFVDGVRVMGSAVSDGSVVRVGDSFLLVRWVSPHAPDLDIESVVGTAPTMQALRSSIGLVAEADATVLIEGETGTGKELVARAIHERSGRPGPLVILNCATISTELAESQLFGHVAGAFTGAHSAQLGFFRAASKGTLFLDEVAELAPAVQAKLLRVIETKEVVPLGTAETFDVDVRVLAATHRPLRAGIDEGWFREDLYARLSELVLETPPLRERPEDVLPLFRRALDGDARPLAPSLVDGLLRDRWRFNVRGLLKVAKELRVRSKGASGFERSVVEAQLETREPQARPSGSAEAPTREELLVLLETYEGNVRRVAEAADRSRKQIYRYLKQHEIDPSSFRRS